MASAEIIGSIDDLLMQILVWLPVKSLLRFKIVSKHWKTLITSHNFILLRNRVSNPNVGLICPICRGRNRHLFDYIPLDVTNPTNPPFSQLRFFGDTFLYWIEQSCNGLLLCCWSGNGPVIPYSFWNRDYHRFFSPIRRCYVYNPTTNCFAKIPRPNGGVPRVLYGLYLAFDPAKSPHYKVVCVKGADFAIEAFPMEGFLEHGRDFYRERFQIEIYSAESGVWRVSGEPFSAMARFNYGAYWNGSIHWISCQPKEFLYFNVNEEKLGKVSLPATISGGGKIETSVGYFGESCDHFHIIEICGERKALLNIYEMKRDYSEWFVKYQVDMTKVDELMNVISGGFSILSLVRVDVGKGGSFLVLQGCGKVIRYNLDCNTFEQISDIGNENHVVKRLLPCAFEHIVSLAGV